MVHRREREVRGRDRLHATAREVQARRDHGAIALVRLDQQGSTTLPPRELRPSPDLAQRRSLLLSLPFDGGHAPAGAPPLPACVHTARSPPPSLAAGPSTSSAITFYGQDLEILIGVSLAVLRTAK